MEKSYQNFFAHTIIKRQGVGTGSLRVFDWRDAADPSAPCLTLFVEIETSDKENEKIITVLAEALSDQFFNAPTETVEFAFESALAKANIALKDTLLIKPKNWLNKIHILVVAGREAELHLSSVGRSHAWLAHRGQIVDVVAVSEGAARTPNPVKLFSNIVSGRLLGQDALVVSNESVLDYLSPERIRKTAQDFDPKSAAAKFNELLSAAPTNKQFALVIIKRLPLPVLALPTSAFTPSVKFEETVTEMRRQPPPPGTFDRQPTVVLDRIIAITNTVGKSVLKITARYSQIGLAATLSGLSKTLGIIQDKLSQTVPRLGKAPKLVVTLWKDDAARTYHLARFKAGGQKRLSRVQAYFAALSPKQKRVLLTTLALAFIFMISIVWRAYDKSAATDKIAYQNRLRSLGQKIDQAEASLIYRDETRSRELLNEINRLLAAWPSGSSAARGRYDEFKNKANNIQNTLDKKQVLGNLSAWLAVPSDNGQTAGFVKTGTDYFYHNSAVRKIAKIDLINPTLADVPAANPLRPWRTVAAYDNNTLALIGEKTFDLLNLKTGVLTNKDLAALPAAGQAVAVYGQNLYVLTPPDSIIRYRENELGSPQPWLKETVGLARAMDIAVDGQIYVLTNSAILIFASGRPSGSISLNLSEPLGQNARFIMEPNLNSLFILDGEHERILHLSKKGDLYNQYLSPDLRNAKAIMVSADAKFVYALNGDKIFRIAVIPPA